MSLRALAEKWRKIPPEKRTRTQQLVLASQEYQARQAARKRIRDEASSSKPSKKG
jgi:hypothetical protein